MRVLGIDPSSRKCGIALVENGELINTWCWKKNESKSGVWNLNDYFEWLTELVTSGQPNSWDAHNGRVIDGQIGSIADMACVEFLSVDRNAQTTRKVSHFQAVSAVVPKQNGLMVIEGRVSSARKEALGAGNMSKENCFKEIKKMFPKHDFLRYDSGGSDETDAVVLALAGPGLAEGK